MAFWSKAQVRRLRGGGRPSGEEGYNIHTPMVMVLSLLPTFGAVAYLAAKPLRNKLLIRLLLDQMAWKLPFKLYMRLGFSRWLAKAPAQAQPTRRGLGTSPQRSV